MDTTPWPPLHAYALAHRCPACKARPGEQCNAPQKQAAVDRSTADGVSVPESWRLHTARQDAGRRHYGRDVARAPWAEDREPGRRYDSLGDAWTPEA
jgi:hypothetical protein